MTDFDQAELLRWAETYGHPEEWAKLAQAAHARAESAEARLEEAERERDEWGGIAASHAQDCRQLEARLARAEEALEWMADTQRAEDKDIYAWANEAHEIARSALQENRKELESDWKVIFHEDGSPSIVPNRKESDGG